ncbi:MAG: glycosyltransferase [Armatimonadota bacterium]|nr:MAG: glycosyltransferase [Armatimonadota bacterium]
MPASAIIPAHQAASTVAQTVRAARKILSVAEVIVVDDGSHDDTAQLARDAGADQVITLPRNRGKGAALRAGTDAANHDRLLFLDADLGDSAIHARDLLHALAREPDMVVAALPARSGSGGFGLALRLSHAAIRLLTGLRTAAPMSGQRALSVVLVKHVGLAPRFGTEVGLTVEAAHLGLPPVEICLPFEHRHTGRTLSGFLHRARQFKDVLLMLLLTGYGLGWPALSRWQVAARSLMWVCALVFLLSLGAIFAPPASIWLAITLGALVLWLPTLWVSAVSLGLRKPNYLGRRLPAASGLLFPVIALPALWFSHMEPQIRASGILLIALLAAVGLLDDLFAPRQQARGLRGHLLSLARGRLTTGAIKAVGGLGAGLAAGIILHPGQPALIALDALLIALTANLLNLLDLRPGRCLKGFGLLSALALILAPYSLHLQQVAEPPLRGFGMAFHLLGPLLAAAIVSAPADFAGRTMMGDVGANVLGAAAGLALVLVLGPWDRLAALLILAAVHLACERFSLSEIMAHSRFLSFLDRLGTVHLPPLSTDQARPT